jgi:hypothetical protein
MQVPNANDDDNNWSRSALESTIKPHSRDNSRGSAAAVTPTIVTSKPPRGGAMGNFTYNPGNLRVATDVAAAATNGRTLAAATPRSGESFASSNNSSRLNGDFTDEDRMFEKIFLSLSRSADLVMRILPAFNGRDFTARRTPVSTAAW